jgi:hypothetical protein
VALPITAGEMACPKLDIGSMPGLRDVPDA